jgi:hypothetical protein
MAAKLKRESQIAVRFAVVRQKDLARAKPARLSAWRLEKPTTG